MSIFKNFKSLRYIICERIFIFKQKKGFKKKDYLLTNKNIGDILVKRINLIKFSLIFFSDKQIRRKGMKMDIRKKERKEGIGELNFRVFKNFEIVVIILSSLLPSQYRSMHLLIEPSLITVQIVPPIFTVAQSRR